MNKITAIAFALFAFASIATAEVGDLTLDLTLASMHGDDTFCNQLSCNGERYNETNPGAGLTYQLTNNISILGGFYKNSYYINTTYAAVNVHTTDFNIVKGIKANVGIKMGLVTGYEAIGVKNINGISPMILPTVKITTVDVVSVSVGYLPELSTDNGDTTSLVTLQMGIKLN